jgi:geranylgeranyl diphosphate synthase type I
VCTREATKKDFRSDITEGKRTLAAVHALEHSEQRDRLLELLAARTEDPALLDEAVAIMNESGSIEFARGYARDLVLSAKTDLEAALPASKARDLLLSMADFFVQRDN